MGVIHVFKDFLKNGFNILLFTKYSQFGYLWCLYSFIFSKLKGFVKSKSYEK